MDLRASDAERERTADVLRHAAGEGRLTVDELDDRLSTAYAATTRGELARLTSDVAEVRDNRPALEVAGGGERNLISVMGGADRKGEWRLAPEVRVLNVMGGNDVDVGPAHPDPGGPVLRIRLIAIMGGNNVKRRRRGTTSP